MNEERIAQLETVAHLAGECRTAQKAYFKNRNRDNLTASIAVERELDAALDALDASSQARQSPLFHDMDMRHA